MTKRKSYYFLLSYIWRNATNLKKLTHRILQRYLIFEVTENMFLISGVSIY